MDIYLQAISIVVVIAMTILGAVKKYKGGVING
jgi:hypothetical protein